MGMNAVAWMSMTMGAILAAAGGAGAHPSAARAADAGSFAGVQDEARIGATDALTIREQAAGFLIVLDPEDSPWTLGRTVEAAARYRSSLGGAGALFIRHDHTFPVLPDARPKFSVGFFVSERMEVAPPFRIEAQSACEVASQMTDGPAWKTGGFVARMTAELNARGLEPAGPFIEFLDAPAGAASAEAQRSRLEVPVRARGSREEDVRRAASAAEEDEGRAESGHGLDAPSPAVPPHSRAAREQVLAFLDSIAATRDSVQWPVMLWEHADALPQVSEAAADGTSPAAEGMSPAASLFLDRRYDELAEVLFPKRRKLSRDQREWLARVFAELRELESSMREVDDALAEEMRQLSEAMKHRAESVRIDLPEPKDLGPRGQRRSVASEDGPSIVLAALHAWSSGPASGGTDPGSRREKLAGILSRIEGVLGEP